VLNIALNKITGGWDEDKLARLLEDLSVCPDFDVSLTGFDLPEVSRIVDEQTRPTEDAFDFDSAVESIKASITKSGDIIHLGPHKLMCGDSGNLDDLKKLMGDDRAQLIYSDPPYNVAYNSKTRPVKDRDKKKWEEIESDNLDQPQYEEWLNNIFTNIGHFLDKGASAYIWNGHRQFYFMHQVLTGLDYYVSSVITWAKDNFAISFAPYNWQTEHCLFFWKKNNGPHNWYGDGKQNNLWYANRDCINNLLHPTQKPVSLAVKAIKNSSKRGDIVLDMFLGSGSTLIASETLNRRTFGIEVNPKYCDAIVRRYIAFVGKEKVSDDILKMYCKEVQHAW
jgi:DNA modification methylase